MLKIHIPHSGVVQGSGGPGWTTCLFFYKNVLKPDWINSVMQKNAVLIWYRYIGMGSTNEIV